MGQKKYSPEEIITMIATVNKFNTYKEIYFEDGDKITQKLCTRSGLIASQELREKVPQKVREAICITNQDLKNLEGIMRNLRGLTGMSNSKTFLK